MVLSVRKLNARIFFNNETFTRVSNMISGAYEIKTARNNDIRNIFNAKYNQITVFAIVSVFHVLVYIIIMYHAF